MINADREALHKEVDKLSLKSLQELQVFVGYLLYQQSHPGSAGFRAMVDAFATVREEIAQTEMTEDEINAIIDEAIEEVRCEQDS